MNTLQRETDPIKLAALIAQGEKEIAVWQMQDRMFNAFLNGTAPEQIENAVLKDQVKTLIQSGESFLTLLSSFSATAPLLSRGTSFNLTAYSPP